MTTGRQTVLILGAGINGCALARELALNDLSVVLVDQGDIAGGTTAYSSRLIHGGLRYLEYGEFDLVRESLAERGRLLRLAPQFVRPLELFVPIRHRWTGLWQSAARFLRLGSQSSTSDRGLWLVRTGLWMYDAYARDPSLPKHRIHRARSGPPIDPVRYRWQASYYDGQVTFPERLSLAFLADACAAAEASGNRVSVLNYHQAQLTGRTVLIRSVGEDSPTLEPFEPAAIINATGAWVDETLAHLDVASPRLIGGTKGSHFLTANPALAAALAGRAIYAEASDGRPVFILPLAGMTLVGTTDEPYLGDPYQATASTREIEYLIAAVREVFPQIALTTADIEFSYSGVRPLPYSDATVPGAISRRHYLKRHESAPLPLYSIVGGKLTTCRSLAEQTTLAVLSELGRPVIANSRERPVPGGEHYPHLAADLPCVQDSLAAEFQLPLDAIRGAWQLCGTQTREILNAADPADRRQTVRDTPLPVAFVRHAIRREWARRLNDLVERRLMLLYKERLTAGCLRHLAELLVAEGRLPADQVEAEVQGTIERLAAHFGKRVEV